MSRSARRSRRPDPTVAPVVRQGKSLAHRSAFTPSPHQQAQQARREAQQARREALRAAKRRRPERSIQLDPRFSYLEEG